MQYRPFGNTGIQISALGFGAMRLPHIDGDESKGFDHEAGAALLRHGIDAGINYVDTAPFYCDSESEMIVGKALAGGYRDKIYLSTKLPKEDLGYSAARARLEASLTRMGTDHIDFYHLWGVSWAWFDQHAYPDDMIKMVLQAKEEGLIRHLSFSFHDDPENMQKLIDTGLFASALCQYNLLDRANEQGMAYAHEKGLGVVVMGPVGGGRLGYPSRTVQALLPGKVQSSPQLALRFVLTNPNVSCALSGMGTVDMVDENARIASDDAPLTDAEQAQVIRSVEENRKRAELYCTGCNYCMPCPVGVNIPLNFQVMNYQRVYDLTDYAREQYASIGKVAWMAGEKASACVGCGACEEKCPQRLHIRDQLAETVAALG